MPNVGGKKYPYTPKGMAQAQAAKKKENPMVVALAKRKTKKG